MYCARVVEKRTCGGNKFVITQERCSKLYISFFVWVNSKVSGDELIRLWRTWELSKYFFLERFPGTCWIWTCNNTCIPNETPDKQFSNTPNIHHSTNQEKEAKFMVRFCECSVGLIMQQRTSQTVPLSKSIVYMVYEILFGVMVIWVTNAIYI